MNKDREIDCAQAQSMIEAFMAGNLEYARQRLFMKHLNSCEECRDEYENRFLVTEGMRRIETGEDFDFEYEVKEKLAAGDGFVRMAIRLKYALAVLIAVVLVMLICYRLGIFVL